MSMYSAARTGLILLLCLVMARESVAGFPPPVQADPSTEFVAHFQASGPATQTFTDYLGFNIDTFEENPQFYWIKYTSDGRSLVTFDTIGSNFGTNGPGNPSASGPVLGSYNQSQIAIYKADGSLVGISKSVRDENGDPIPYGYLDENDQPAFYPKYDNGFNQWYAPVGLSEVHLRPNAPGNPHWDVSPTDPTPFEGWSAPGNEGNGQKYFQPHYPTDLNEYAVWDTALSTIILDQAGNPVIDPNTNQPRNQPGWRYFDRARHGPGTPWNQFEMLEEGEYYIAVGSPVPTFAGDTYVEEVLQAPIHGYFDFNTFQYVGNVPKLTGPLGTFEYFEEDGSGYMGHLVVNATITGLEDGDANGDLYVDDLDYALLLASFGESDARWGMGDFDADDVVTIRDGMRLLANYGSSPSATVVPEPASLSLLAIGALALARRRR